ncbi:hypothetical protein B0T22DRAFT_89650 [Podospora appendiculata]|uniref:HFB protein n=1 Tax=Podospora appendiculata TaxID=314037 RepID=A0AAE1CHX7_9PEZI|nr:hypothetical protein B0T22DRAFT_89650 [Podospora appendiculata]
MRFTTLLLSSLFAVLAAAEPTATASAPAVQNSEQAAILACLNACKAGDVACTSKCIAVPNPDASQVNSTNTCVAACNQGSGTATDNLNYANCVEGCIGKYYFTDSGTPAPATAVAAGGNSNVGSATVSPTASASGSGTASGSSVNKPAQTQGDAATHTSSGVATATSNAAVAGSGGGGRSAVAGLVVGGLAALLAL